MVIGADRGYMVGGFFGEDLCKLSILGRKGFLRFLCFGLHGKAGGHGEFVDCGRGLGGKKL